jgi:pimeloyl-ACP methyl ester carboxylesterase
MAKTTSAHRPFRFLVTALAALVVVTGTTACEPRPPQKDRVVIFVHGYSALGAGVNCANSFGSLQNALRADGFTGTFVTIGFYDSDTNCDVNLRSIDAGISNSSSWKTLSKAFSRYVHDTYSSQNIPVDVVGHSMGGLIARGAVQGSAAGEPGFAGPLRVEDAVTLAAPHAGAAWYSYLCFWGQCSQLKPGAADLGWLATTPDPQALGGTDWTVLGSTADDVVPDASALSMGVPDERKVRYTDLEHSDYQSNATSQARTALALAEVDR